MSGGNYDEGVERIHLANANNDTHQQHLRERQQKRLKTRVFGIAVAIAMVAVGYGSIWYHSRNQDKALILLQEIATYLHEGSFERAQQSAESVIETGNYVWHGHFYNTIALIYLNRREEAQRAAVETHRSFEAPYPPLHFHPVLALAVERELGKEKTAAHIKKLEKNFGSLKIFSLYINKGKICYPSEAILKPDYGKIEAPALSCFPDRVLRAFRAPTR